MTGFICDCHTHSGWSPDGKDSAEAMCLRAAELGLDVYTLTDHCDCNYWLTAEEFERESGTAIAIDREMYGSRDYSAGSIDEVGGLKERFPFLLCGIELGQPMQDIQAAERTVSRPELDFVIGSHHQNAGQEDFYWLKYDKMDLPEIYACLDDYFAEMLAMCRWGKFDVLGHLTYPLRYIVGDYGIPIDMAGYEERIREIFRTLAGSGRGIEINTSGLRQKYGRTFPDAHYVKLWKECGGEIITVGSDAHCTADLGKGIADGIELAKECGFGYIAYFRERKPQFVKV